jgi:hypothetical protein
MKWLNIEIETLRGAEFLGAEPVERATWLSLLGFCAAQENSGEIPDCIDWGSRKWQQLCGVTKEEIEIGSELYGFDGRLDVGTLYVHFYPITQQAAVKAKREAGKKGGRPKKVESLEPLKTKEEKPHGYEDDNHMVPDSFNSLKGEHERNSNSKGNSNSKSKESLVSTETGESFRLRICKLYKRRPTTKWSDKETRAFKKLEIIEEDMQLIEKYCNADSGCEYRRRDIQTLLNNWNGEVDRAVDWRGGKSTNYRVEENTNPTSNLIPQR